MLKNRITLIFVALSILCIILKNNVTIFEWWPIKIVESYGNDINKIIYRVINYSQIDRENKSVLEENRRLREKLINNIDIETKPSEQTKLKNFEFINAKVVYNSIIRLNNYIILDKGAKDGIKPHMAVISCKGIVGKVKYVSKSFCSVISVLNTHMRTSILIESTPKYLNQAMIDPDSCYDKENSSRNIFATLSWDGKNYKKAVLLYVPQHVDIKTGQHVVTSGYNAIFPPNILVGKVSSFTKKRNKMFYDIYVDLENDFSSLNNVFVIVNNNKIERDSLLKKTIKFYE